MLNEVRYGILLVAHTAALDVYVAVQANQALFKAGAARYVRLRIGGAYTTTQANTSQTSLNRPQDDRIGVSS